MGFSSIPSRTIGPGGVWNDVGQASNALTKGNLDNQILQAQAKYAPYQSYANASKTMQEAQFMPYQRLMGMLPMMLLGAQNNPELQNRIVQMMNPMNNSMLMPGSTDSAPNMPGGMPNMPVPGQGGGMPGMPGMPTMPLPGQSNQSGGLLGMLQSTPIGQFVSNIFGKNQPQQQNQMPQGNATPSNPLINPGATSGVPQNQGDQNTQGQGSPLVPATQGGPAAIIGRYTAPLVQGPYGPAVLIPDPNNPKHVVQVPTSKMSTQLQTQVSAANRMLPEFNELPNLWGPFMDLKGYGNLVGAKVGNFISSSTSPQIMDQLKKFGITDKSDLPSKYTDAKMAAITSVEAYLKSIGIQPTVFAQKHIKDMIEPEIGENADGYQHRIQLETQRIVKDYVSQALNQIEQGYPTAPNQYQTNQSPQNIETANYVSANKQPVSMGIGVNAGKKNNIRPEDDVPLQTKIMDDKEYRQLKSGKWIRIHD